MSVTFGDQDAHGGTPLFSVSLHSAPDRLVVCLAGELDLACDAEIRAVLDKIVGHGAAVTIVDLSDVTFIDAHGIGLLVSVHRSAAERGQALGVVGLRGVVAHVFSLFPLEALALTAAGAHDHEGDLGDHGCRDAIGGA